MRERYEAYIRETVRRIQADSRVTDAARRSADVPVHKTTRTPVPAPATAPRGQVVATDRFEHTITVSDSATPTRRGKPTGAVGCEVYVCVADNVPVTPEAYRFVGVWTRTPERVTFEPQDGGRTAHYLFRWVGTRGETGPWSDPTSATIPAF